MTSRTPALDQLLDLADAVAADGVAAHRPAVADVVACARGHGVRPVLVEILEDPSAPEAVHQRALGRLIVALCAPAPQGGDRRPCDPPDPARRRALAAA
jgi:hypothetical protein